VRRKFLPLCRDSAKRGRQASSIKYRVRAHNPP
jgi:hypothetical protein